MIEIFHHELIVSEDDIDILGHVNNVVYIQWMQDAALAHSAALGWPARRYHEMGAGWVARLHQIEYLQPAHAGDLVRVKTWVADMKKVTSLRKYEFVRIGTRDTQASERGTAKEIVLAVAHTNWAFIDFKARTPKRIPPEIASAYQPVSNSAE
ncbi:MAG: acyl-CoA thioesterase [Pirellula sp.]|jgi:acyl-CoA thioester hydrolase